MIVLRPETGAGVGAAAPLATLLPADMGGTDGLGSQLLPCSHRCAWGRAWSFVGMFPVKQGRTSKVCSQENAGFPRASQVAP